MLFLVFALGSTIIIFFARERASGTYRCPYCAKLEVGTHHRLKCFLLNKQGDMVQAESEPHFHDSSRREPGRFEFKEVAYTSGADAGIVFASSRHSGIISQTPNVSNSSL